MRKPEIKRPQRARPFAVGSAPGTAVAPPLVDWSVAPSAATYPLNMEILITITVDDCGQAARIAEHLSRALVTLPE